MSSVRFVASLVALALVLVVELVVEAAEQQREQRGEAGERRRRHAHTRRGEPRVMPPPRAERRTRRTRR
jgi:hypothetical protein